VLHKINFLFKKFADGFKPIAFVETCYESTKSYWLWSVIFTRDLY